NDLPGFSTNSYGLLTVDAGNAEVDGRMTYYRLDGDTWGDEFDFVYSLELMPGVVGETNGAWNMYVPGKRLSGGAELQLGAELELGTPVTMISAPTSNSKVGTATAMIPTITPNWLSIANLDSSTRNFTITYRDQTGDIITTATLVIPSLGKRDIQAGHEFSTSGAVGLISITPESNSVPYIATVSRYGDNFAFAVPTRSGTEAQVMLPAGGEGLNVLELSNASNVTNHVELNWYDMNGALLKTEIAHLPPYSQQHFIPADVLPEGSYGSVVITAGNKIIAGAASYLYNNSGIATAHYLDGRENFGRVLSGTYNTYLEMDNWLRLTNRSLLMENVQLDFGGGVTDFIQVPAHGRRDILVPSGASVLSAEAAYGGFTLEASVSGAISVSLVRNRLTVNGPDFQTVLPLR
ncbi:MAG: hypothetical protein PHC51_09885, partial [bacterium]|nr:hypothetical protein [bacterium]